jgi:hypothetical protein
MDEYTVAAALYSEKAPTARVSVQWLESMESCLSGQVPIKECDFYGAGCIRLGFGSFKDLRGQLWSAVAAGSVIVVEMHAHHEKDRGLALMADASASIDLDEGNAFLGLPESSSMTEAEVLKYLYSASKGITKWRYGVGFTHATLRAPGLYAIGMAGGSSRDDGVTRFEDSEKFLTGVARWGTERRGERRYLHGFFRDIYYANLLSEEHLQARLRDNTPLYMSGLGSFEQLDPGVWLWELPTEQLAGARAALREVGLMIC